MAAALDNPEEIDLDEDDNADEDGKHELEDHEKNRGGEAGAGEMEHLDDPMFQPL